MSTVRSAVRGDPAEHFRMRWLNRSGVSKLPYVVQLVVNQIIYCELPVSWDLHVCNHRHPCTSSCIVGVVNVLACSDVPQIYVLCSTHIVDKNEKYHEINNENKNAWNKINNKTPLVLINQPYLIH